VPFNLSTHEFEPAFPKRDRTGLELRKSILSNTLRLPGKESIVTKRVALVELKFQARKEPPYWLTQNAVSPRLRRFAFTSSIFKGLRRFGSGRPDSLSEPVALRVREQTSWFGTHPEIRENKGKAILLLVDVLRAGAGMDGIYSASRELTEEMIFHHTKIVTRGQVGRELFDKAELALKQVRYIGERKSLSKWQQIQFFASLPCLDSVGRRKTLYCLSHQLIWRLLSTALILMLILFNLSSWRRQLLCMCMG